MATKIVTKNSSTASAVPTASDLVQGELAVNVADKRLFTEDNGGSIVELGTNPSSLTVSGNIDVDGVTNLDAVDIDGAVDMASTLQVDGAATFTTEITANGGIALGDNDKATFGAGDDLQIFHNGTDSLIREVGTGGLKIDTNGPDITLRVNATESAIVANSNGSVDLYYDNAKKLATTSTGIDVTGTATMDGLVVDGTSVLDSETNFVANSTASNKSLVLASSGATGGNGQYGASVAFSRINSESPRAAIAAVNTDSNYERMGLSFWTHPNNTADVMVKRMQIDHDGDISFYEDTGTTAKLFWAASAERLGIGTSSPSYKTEIVGGNLGVGGGAGASQLGVEIRGIALSAIPSAQVRGYIATGDSTIGVAGDLLIAPRTNVAASVRFITGTTPTERLRIDSSGRVGIGTSSPSAKLHVSSSGDTIARITSADGNGAFLDLGDASDPDGGRIVYDSGSNLGFSTASTERMRIDSAGRVGIGTSSPATALEVNGDIGIGRISGGYTFREITGGNERASLKSNASNELLFNIGASTEAMRIDSAGNVGIGISPAAKFDVLLGSTSRLLLRERSSRAYIDSVTETNGAFDSLGINGSEILFETDGTERMRIDSSGNLLVGTTDSNVSNNNGSGTGFNFLASGQQKIATDDNLSLILNRLNGDGGIVEFKKDGTAVGSIGSCANSGIIVGTTDVALRFRNQAGGASIFPRLPNDTGLDNVVDLGLATARFDDIYATNGTIQTSDRNEKQDIAELSDAEQRVAVAAKGLLRKFRWKDSVAEKGDDARIHFGIIAQDLQAVFEAEGLDAGDYAMFISTTWTDEETNEEKTRMGVRYSELLAFIIAAI